MEGGGTLKVKNVSRLSIDSGQYRYWTNETRETMLEEQIARLEIIDTEEGGKEGVIESD